MLLLQFVEGILFLGQQHIRLLLVALQDASVVLVALELKPLILLPEVHGVLLVLLFALLVSFLYACQVIQDRLFGQVLDLLEWDIWSLLLNLEDSALQSL